MKFRKISRAQVNQFVVAVAVSSSTLGCSSQKAPEAPPCPPKEPVAVVTPPPEPNKDAPKGKPGPASEATKAAQAALLAALPFKDTTDFENAKKGFIAPLPNEGIIKDAKGNVVWNLKAYSDYIKQGEKAPETVNPSLWRVAQLMMVSGLFEVVPGVYQVRGADLSNMTIVEGARGVTIYDPLISAETAKAALDLYYQHRPKKPVVAVVYSHSHVDHFGGVRGIVDEADVKAGKVKIFAPVGFLNDAVAENVFAGTAMSRRASYMYGNLLPIGPEGQATAGLGVTTSSGSVTVIPPTDLISKSEESRVIDGVTYEFLNAPGSEAPSEMMWYLPKFKLINTAEDSTHTMHNLYTLRGAKTRDADKWPGYLNVALRKWGKSVEVEIGMHHWPTWTQAGVVTHIKSQRDIYKYLHDQTLHFANQGFTINELPEKVVVPPSLVDQWATHGYYGSQSHNVRAVYNFYLGYFDGNPANLNPLPPEQVAKKYVEALGGPGAVLALGKKAFVAGEYRWGAEVMKHLVFAHPENQEARNVLADILEQMGYQAEAGTWRNFYLGGAKELRDGVTKAATPNTASTDVLGSMSFELIFGYMGIQLDAEKAKGRKITLNWEFPDVKAKHALYLENSVLNHWPDFHADDANATIKVDRVVLNEILAGKLSFPDAVTQGKVKVEGDAAKFQELMGMLVNLGDSFWFGVVTP